LWLLKRLLSQFLFLFLSNNLPHSIHESH
jgi:hypothetical protein